MKKDLIPKKVLSAFGLSSPRSVIMIASGLIHQTYCVDSGKDKYIIQRLHPILASEEIAEDFLAVTKFLHEQNFLAPQCVLSKNGSVLVHINDFAWRAQTFIAGKTVHRLKNVAMAKEAGMIYAKFHKTLAVIPYQFKSKKVLHDTEKIFETFRKTVDSYRDSELMMEVHLEVEFLFKQTPKYFLPKSLPLRVIHGDPKISNILFDLNGKAKAIVDLDTCNRRPLLVELGDAFRSWCGGVEDDSKNTFSIPLFRAAWKGYESIAKSLITKKEKQQVSKSIGTITLELACRFMTDYFADTYFGWDSTRYSSRRLHNLARVRGQIAEFKDYQKKQKEIQKIVS